jgi:hypothetical protein
LERKREGYVKKDLKNHSVCRNCAFGSECIRSGEPSQHHPNVIEHDVAKALKGTKKVDLEGRVRNSKKKKR